MPMVKPSAKFMPYSILATQIEFLPKHTWIQSTFAAWALFVRKRKISMQINVVAHSLLHNKANTVARIMPYSILAGSNGSLPKLKRLGATLTCEPFLARESKMVSKQRWQRTEHDILKRISKLLQIECQWLQQMPHMRARQRFSGFEFRPDGRITSFVAIMHMHSLCVSSSPLSSPCSKRCWQMLLERSPLQLLARAWAIPRQAQA